MKRIAVVEDNVEELARLRRDAAAAIRKAPEVAPALRRAVRETLRVVAEALRA